MIWRVRTTRRLARAHGRNGRHGWRFWQNTRATALRRLPYLAQALNFLNSRVSDRISIRFHVAHPSVIMALSRVQEPTQARQTMF